MNKRERLLYWLDQDQSPGYIPAAFFIHFPQEYRRGQAAIDKHLAYFRYTGMDFVKIQYEFAFPHRPDIQRPEDWATMPSYGREFFQDQLDIVAGLVKAARGEALIIQTLYSPFMSAGHTTSDAMITEHIKTDPEKVKQGLEIITESTLWFVRECIKLGVDGFYASTQGGESHRFADPSLFAQYVKPYDLAVMEEINRTCLFNILHICDYCGGYTDLTPFLDYPGDVVNCTMKLGAQTLTPRDVAQMFERPTMGGIDRHGTIVTGSRDEIKTMVRAVLQDAPERFILGADCTLPGDINWDNIKTTITTTHEYQPGLAQAKCKVGNS
jgi:uroporphyrinogen decarboxylase